MKKIFFYILSGTLILMGCDSPQNHKVSASQKNSFAIKTNLKQMDLKLEANWIEGPWFNLEQSSYLIVTIKNYKDLRQSLPEGYELEFSATMPSMGHGLDQPGYFEQIFEGVYQNPEIYLQMTGEWDFQISIWDEEGNLVESTTWNGWVN
jgi:hypothetical protein